MSTGYELTTTAEDELGTILSHVAAKDGVRYALQIHDEFEKAFELLAFQPGSGTTRPQLTGERMRWSTVFKWIVVYDPNLPPISVVHHAIWDLVRHPK